MPETCSICGEVVADRTVLCWECAELLRWVRGYFAHVSGLDMQIAPQTTSNDLWADGRSERQFRLSHGISVHSLDVLLRPWGGA